MKLLELPCALQMADPLLQSYRTYDTGPLLDHILKRRVDERGEKRAARADLRHHALVKRSSRCKAEDAGGI
jgi:hypothetical protein